MNTYSIEPLLQLRQTTSAKVCYRQDLTFLKYSKNLTQSISNRFVINSNYYRSYKNLRQCYINMLRANFCNKTPHLLKPWILNNFDNKAFFLLYEKDKAFYDLDYALIWRASQINSLFNLATTITRKKKSTRLNLGLFTLHLVNAYCLFENGFLCLWGHFMLKDYLENSL